MACRPGVGEGARRTVESRSPRLRTPELRRIKGGTWDERPRPSKLRPLPRPRELWKKSNFFLKIGGRGSPEETVRSPREFPHPSREHLRERALRSRNTASGGGGDQPPSSPAPKPTERSVEADLRRRGPPTIARSRRPLGKAGEGSAREGSRDAGLGAGGGGEWSLRKQKGRGKTRQTRHAGQ